MIAQGTSHSSDPLQNKISIIMRTNNCFQKLQETFNYEVSTLGSKISSTVKGHNLLYIPILLGSEKIAFLFKLEKCKFRNINMLNSLTNRYLINFIFTRLLSANFRGLPSDVFSIDCNLTVD